MGALNRAGILIGVPLLIMAALAAYQLLAYRALVDHERQARETIGALRALSAALRDAESGQRGYLLSGDSRFLDTHHEAARKVPERMRAVQGRLSASHADRLDRLVNERLEQLAETLDHFSAGETAAAIGRLRDGDGQQTMLEATGLVEQLVDEQQSTIDDLQAKTRARYLWTLVLLVLATGIGLGLGFAARRLVRARMEEVQRTADALALSEERYRALVDSAPDAVFVNADGRIAYFNQAFAQLLGAPAPTALVGKSPLEFIAPEHHAAVRLRIEKVRAGQTTPPMEQQWLRCDGSRFTALVSAAPYNTAQTHDVQVTVRDITELKHAAAAIERSEARIRRVLDNLYVFVGVLDPHGVLLEANHAPLQRAGLTLSDVRGKHFWDCYWWLHDVEIRGRVEAAVMAARDGQASRFDVQAQMMGGDTLDIDLMIAPVYDDQRQLLWIVASAVDISDRVAAEQRLARSEAQARHDRREIETIYAQAPIGLCQLDAQLRFRRVNERLAAITGHSINAHLGVRMVELLPATGRELEAVAMGVLRTGQPVIGMEIERSAATVPDSALRGPEGTWRLSCFAQRDDHGAIVGVNALVEDITEQQRLDRALRDSERRETLRAQQLESLMMAVPAAVWIAHDAGCKQVTGNRESYELLKMPLASNVSATPDSARHRPFVELIDGRPAPADALPLQRAAATNAPVRDVRLSFLFNDGELRHVVGHAAPLRDDAGHAIGAVAAFMDVTELHRARDALSEAARRKDEFLAMLAHELRNPLAPIGNAAALLAFYARDDVRLRRLHQIVSRQVTHLARLVDDLLDISRITRGKVTLDLGRVDLAEIARAAVESTAERLGTSNLQIALRGADAPAWVDGDPVRLTQVVTNLLDNAVKYSPQGGEVTVAITRSPAEHELTVSDQGQGIDPSLLPHVFDLFVQGEQSLDRTRGGLGIGLTLVRRLVGLHGGTVEAASDGVGRGARFTVRLPARTDNGVTPPASQTSDRQPLRLVVVDDNRDAADSVADLLRLHGHAVRVAYDADGAFAVASKHWPDVFILDLGLPGMNGFELAQALKQRHRDRSATFIALTGYGQAEDRERSLAAGFSQHLVKPISVDALLDALAGVTTDQAAVS
jgi:PAS domain S-box-containing protein